MAKAKTDDLSRAYHIVQQALQFNNATKEELAYLKKLWNSNREFRDWFESNTGNFVTLSSGRVRDAKDAYNTFGFTPLQKAKDEGPGTNRLIARSGLRTNQTGAFQDAKIYTNGKSQVAGGRVRTSGETAAVIKRGLAGGKLSDEDQRIFDRWQTIQRETEQNRQLAAAQQAAAQQAAAQRAQDRAAKLQLLGIKDNGSLNDLQINDLIAQREAKLKYDAEYANSAALARHKAWLEADAAKEKAKRDEEIAKEKRRQQEIDNGRTADMTDDDYAQFMQYGGSKFAQFDYNERDRAEIETARKKIREGLNNGTLSKEEADAATAQLDQSIANGRWKKEVTRRSNMPEGQPVISDDGQFYVSDGKWTPMPKPDKPVVEKPTGASSLTFKDILSQVPKTRIGKDADGNEIEVDIPFNERMQMAQEEWDNIQGSQPIKGDPGNCEICGEPLNEQGLCTNPGCSQYAGGAYIGGGERDEIIAPGAYAGAGGSPSVVGDQETPILSQPAAQPQGHIKSSYL